MPYCYNEAETLNYILEILKSENKTGVKRCVLIQQTMSAVFKVTVRENTSL